MLLLMCIAGDCSAFVPSTAVNGKCICRNDDIQSLTVFLAINVTVSKNTSVPLVQRILAHSTAYVQYLQLNKLCMHASIIDHLSV